MGASCVGPLVGFSAGVDVDSSLNQAIQTAPLVLGLDSLDTKEQVTKCNTTANGVCLAGLVETKEECFSIASKKVCPEKDKVHAQGQLPFSNGASCIGGLASVPLATNPSGQLASSVAVGMSLAMEGCPAKSRHKMLYDPAVVRPCRSSARVSEKEKRELENAVREQGLLLDQDSREGKEKGRRENRSGLRESKSSGAVAHEEAEGRGGQPEGARGRLLTAEKQAAEEARKPGGMCQDTIRPEVTPSAGSPVRGAGEAAEKGKDCGQPGVSESAAGEKTKKAAYWTHEEEEVFFSSLRQFGKNFEKIQARVKSKDKEQVRHYYYRCIKRMNRLLRPSMLLDISDPLLVTTAMLRWWQLRADVKGDITDLHRKPRKQKQFQTAFEKAFTADLHRKAKARKKQAACAPIPSATPSCPVPDQDSARILGDTVAVPTNPTSECKGSGATPSLPVGGIDSEAGKRVGLVVQGAARTVRAGGKARKAQVAGQAARKMGSVPVGHVERGKGKGPLAKGGAGSEQSALGTTSKAGPKAESKRGRANGKERIEKGDSCGKRGKGRGKGAGEVIDDVGTLPGASSRASLGVGRSRRVGGGSDRMEVGGGVGLLNGLADAAAQLEKLAVREAGMSADGRVVAVSGGVPSQSTDGTGQQTRREGGEQVRKEEGQAGGKKLTLQLFPFDRETEERLKQAHFNPFLELSLKSRKSLASIAEHLIAKWSLGHPRDSHLLPCTLRLLPNIDDGKILSGLSWGVADKSVSAAEVFALMGKPDVFRLKYRLLPHETPLSPGAHTHHVTPQQQGAPWQVRRAPPFLPASPLRPGARSDVPQPPAVQRGSWASQPGGEVAAMRQGPVAPVGSLGSSPVRGSGSYRAFSWAADPPAEQQAAVRYMPVAGSAPLGRGPIGVGVDGGRPREGPSLSEEGAGEYGAQRSGEQGSMAPEGRAWLDDVEGVSISAFLNMDGSRGVSGSPFADGNRSRFSLGLMSPPFSPPLWSPESTSRATFRAPADRVPGIPRSRNRLTAANALVGSILQEQGPSVEMADGAVHGSRSGLGLGAAGVGGWDGDNDEALPLRDLVAADSLHEVAPLLDSFGMALSTDGFDVQLWDKEWGSRSRFPASPLSLAPPRQEMVRRSPEKGPPSCVSVAEAEAVRVEEGPWEDGPAEERGSGKERSDPELYWGNSLGAFEEPRALGLEYGGAGQDDFLLRAPTPPDIPFGDSLLLRSLETSNDGFLPATRDVPSKQGARRASARRVSGAGLGSSRGSGELVSPTKRTRMSGSVVAREEGGSELLLRSSSPTASSGIGDGHAEKGGGEQAMRSRQSVATAIQGESGVGRSPLGGGGSAFQVNKAAWQEEARADRADREEAATSKPFLALFPALPGQLTQEELVPAEEVAAEDGPSGLPLVKGDVSPVCSGDEALQLQTEDDKEGERLSKRKAKAKSKGDRKSKLQKQGSDQVQLGKRAAELSQANKAAAAAINSCFGRSPFARPSWQNP